MRQLNEYVLNYGTSLFLPDYDELGNSSSIVMENGIPLKSNLDPTALIDYNLRYYGSSLRGASDGSRMILGEISMQPIIISEKLGIYWFPSKSPSKKDCVWFAMHHIKDYGEIDNKKTRIIFNNGNTIIIDISTFSFEKKIQRAYKLKCKMESRTNQFPNITNKSQTFYHISKGINDRNYDLNSKDTHI